jgi:hypothetical protein
MHKKIRFKGRHYGSAVYRREDTWEYLSYVTVRKLHYPYTPTPIELCSEYLRKAFKLSYCPKSFTLNITDNPKCLEQHKAITISGWRFCDESATVRRVGKKRGYRMAFYASVNAAIDEIFPLTVPTFYAYLTNTKGRAPV